METGAILKWRTLDLIDWNGGKYGPDGSLEIYIQHDLSMKDKNSNWLHAPMGDFLLFFRAYMSTKELLDG